MVRRRKEAKGKEVSLRRKVDGLEGWLREVKEAAFVLYQQQKPLRRGEGEKMTTLQFRKAVEEIEEPTLMPVDWYQVEITEEPDFEDNSKKKKGLSEEEGAGQNLVVNLRTIHDDPEFSGRYFRLWLPWPNESDEEARDGRGQRKSDSKMKRIAEFVTAFGGDVDGSELVVKAGMSGQVYIDQNIPPGQTEIQNGVSLFAGFKPFDVADSDIPF